MLDTYCSLIQKDSDTYERLESLAIVMPLETKGFTSSFNVPRVLPLILKKGTAFRAVRLGQS